MTTFRSEQQQERISIPIFHFEEALGDILREKGFNPIPPVAWEIADRANTPHFMGILGVGSINFSTVTGQGRLCYAVEGLRIRRPEDANGGSNLLFIGSRVEDETEPEIDMLARFSIIDYANGFLKALQSPYRFELYMNGHQENPDN